MKNQVRIFTFLGVLGILSCNVMAEESIKSDIVKIDILMNGIGVIERNIQTKKTASDNIYVWEKPVTAIDGSWYFSGAAVGASVVNRLREQSIEPYNADLLEIFGGKEVEINYGSDGKELENIVGTLLIPPQDNPDNVAVSRPIGTGYFYICNSNGGIMALERSRIRSIKAKSINAATNKFKSVMLLETTQPNAAKIHYMSGGILWSPEYIINLAANNKLTINANAIIKNELEDFENVDVRIVSGSPRLKNAAPLSLLSPGITINNFFNPRQVDGQDVRYDYDYKENYSVRQKSVLSDRGGEQVFYDSSISDLFFQPVGKISMKKGAAKFIELGTMEAEFNSLVTWTIQPEQNIDRRWYGPQNNPKPAVQEIWDCVVFRNPFDFPISGSVISIYNQGNFTGQTESDWINPKQEATLKIAKAFSIEVSSTDEENTKIAPVSESYNNSTYSKVVNVGTLKLTSFRDTPQVIKIEKSFFGRYIEPKTDQLAAKNGEDENIPQLSVSNTFYNCSYNTLSKLSWTITLQPKEEKVITFQYNYLR